MIGLLLSSLLVGSISADVVPSASVSFPQFGAVQSIEGIITFQVGADNTGVEIISSSKNGLSGFPKELGPFLWHGNQPRFPDWPTRLILKSTISQFRNQIRPALPLGHTLILTPLESRHPAIP